MIAAIDVSLASTTVGVFDDVRRDVVDVVTIDHALDNGEVSPLEWLRAVDEAWTRLGSPVVNAVGVAAFGSGLVVLDSVGRPARAVWDDDRSEPDAGWCRKKLAPEWWESETGIIPESRHAVTKMSWVHRSEVEVWNAAASFALPFDFVASRLAGLDGVVTSSVGSIGYGLYRSADDEVHSDITTLIDSDRDWSDALPRVVSSTTPIGRWNGAVVFAGIDRDRFSPSGTKPQVVRDIAMHFESLLK